jgi:hypothetical protein
MVVSDIMFIPKGIGCGSRFGNLDEFNPSSQSLHPAGKGDTSGKAFTNSES